MMIPGTNWKRLFGSIVPGLAIALSGCGTDRDPITVPDRVTVVGARNQNSLVELERSIADVDAILARQQRRWFDVNASSESDLRAYRRDAVRDAIRLRQKMGLGLANYCTDDPATNTCD